MKHYNKNMEMLQREAKGGVRLRKELAIARENIGLRQVQIAEILGISRSFYGLIENGVRNPDYGLAKRIAKTLKVSPESIFFDLDGFKMKQIKQRDSP